MNSNLLRSYFLTPTWNHFELVIIFVKPVNKFEYILTKFSSLARQRRWCKISIFYDDQMETRTVKCRFYIDCDLVVCFQYIIYFSKNIYDTLFDLAIFCRVFIQCCSALQKYLTILLCTIFIFTALFLLNQLTIYES